MQSKREPEKDGPVQHEQVECQTRQECSVRQARGDQRETAASETQASGQLTERRRKVK